MTLETVTFRRVDDGARLRLGPSTPSTSVRDPLRDTEVRVVTLVELDAFLDARRYPADFWACIHAADDAYESGEHDALIEWPSGRRSIAI